MVLGSSAEPPTGVTRTLPDLIRQREPGLDRYAFFFLTGEGQPLPSGGEETSGFLIDDRGRVFSFWLGWDPLQGQPALTEWRQVQPQVRWKRSAEYRRARQQVGLPVA